MQRSLAAVFPAVLIVAVANARGEASELVTSADVEVALQARLNEQLEEAVKKGNATLVKDCLAKGADDPDSNPKVLTQAIQFGHAPVVQELLSHGASVNAPLPLFDAARCYRSGDERSKIVVKKLLWLGASVNSKNGITTPLHTAIENGHIWLVQELLKYGADVNVNEETAAQFTPLRQAVYYHPELIGFLVGRGAVVDARNSRQETALHYAILSRRFSAAKELVEHHASLDAHDSEGEAPLHLAAKMGLHRIVRLLVHNTTADIMEPTDYGKTAYEVAEMFSRRTNHKFHRKGADSHFPEVLRELKNAGGDPGVLAGCFSAVSSDWWMSLLALLGGLGCGALAAAALVASNALGIRTSGTDCHHRLLGAPDAWDERQAGGGHDAGALLLAAQHVVKLRRCGAARGLLRKLYYMGEVILNMILVFGPCMYHRTPSLVLLIWFVFWVLPAALNCGWPQLLSNPVLVASSGRSKWLKILAAARLPVLLYAANVALLFGLQHVGSCEAAWRWPDARNAKLQAGHQFDCSVYYTAYRGSAQRFAGTPAWDTNATLTVSIPRLGGPSAFQVSKTVVLDEIDMKKWFLHYERAVLVLAVAGAAAGLVELVLTVLCPSQGADQEREEVREWAAKAERVGTADGVAEVGLKPLVWYSLGLRVALLASDVLLDINVMLNLLSRRHYVFFGVMLAIFSRSIFLDALQQKGLFNLRRDFVMTVEQGYLTKGLLSTFSAEAGWEAFGQLAVTTYGLAFLTQGPAAFLSATLSILTSSWTLANHLYQLIDLGQLMAYKED